MIVGCQTTSNMKTNENQKGWPFGESLVVEPPLNNSSYAPYTKTEQGWKSSLWQSKTHGGGDSFVVNVINLGEGDVDEFRLSQDFPGKKSCNIFESDTISTKDRNGYKSLFWETNCDLGNLKVKTLQIVIIGNDKLYHIRKLWKRPVSNEEYQNWKNHIDKASVCDTRKNSCPKGYRKASNT